MTLNEITTPTVRRRVIRYGRDGNKVVRRWFPLQHVTGPIYMGNFREDNCHQPIFDLYVFFPEVKDGLFWRCMMYPDGQTVEKLEQAFRMERVNSKEEFVKALHEHMECDRPVGNAEIEFVRQWDAPLADRCAEYRAARYARMEEARNKHIAEVEAEEAREKAEAEAALQTEKAKYLGWANDMTPMQYGKMHRIMEEIIKCDGKYVSRREFVISSVKAGWMPEQKDGVVGWYHGQETKPRTEYRLRKGSQYYKVSKTEFDFAKYYAEQMEV